MSWTASANALIANMHGKPDYLMIAILEVETWGRVFTAESKKFEPLPSQRRGSGLWQSEASLQRNVDEMNALLADLGME